MYRSTIVLLALLLSVPIGRGAQGDFVGVRGRDFIAPDGQVLKLRGVNLGFWLEPFYKRLVAAIREVDPQHIIFLEGAFWARNFDVFGPPFDPKLAYTTHLYNSTDQYTSFEYYLAFGKKYNVPVWLGEFGETEAVWVGQMRRACEDNHIGWCLWSIKKMDDNHTLLQITPPEDFAKIQKFLDASIK